MAIRMLLIAWALLLTEHYVSRASTDQEPRHAALSTLPHALGGWHGTDRPPLDADVARTLGADEYLSRFYGNSRGERVDLYVAFYGSQQQGDTMHSPRQCLPGNGWQPASATRVTLDGAGRPLVVNRYIVEKGAERAAVFYWFQGRGRATPSEYANKAFLVLDALRLHRTDGALVRVMTPATHSADRIAQAFVRALAPQLSRTLP